MDKLTYFYESYLKDAVQLAQDFPKPGAKLVAFGFLLGVIAATVVRFVA